MERIRNWGQSLCEGIKIQRTKGRERIKAMIEAPQGANGKKEPTIEKRDHFPFVRAPLKPIHFIPIVGLFPWLRDERRVMSAVPEDAETPDYRHKRLASLATLLVTTWPEPRTPTESIEHMKTQAIHGTMLGYHWVIGTIGLLEILKRT